MSIPGTSYFIAGLVGLCVGNGLLKPNISVMVGNLYDAADPKRDAGFNIFYMGINIGAFVASFLSSGVRNEWGWLWTFRVAGFGLLVGLVVLLASWKVLERADRTPESGKGDAGFATVFFKILLPAFGAGLVGYLVASNVMPDGPVRPPVVGFLVGMIPVIIFFVRLGKTAPPKERPGLKALLPVYLAGATFFMILHLNGSAMTQWARDDTDREMQVMPEAFQQEGLPRYYLNAAEDVPRPDPRSLLVTASKHAARMYGQQRLDEATVALLAQDPSVEVRIIPSEDKSDIPKQIVSRAADVFATGTVTVQEETDAHGGKVFKISIPDRAEPLRRVAFVRQVEGREIALFVVDDETTQKIYQGFEERFEHPPALLPPGDFLPVINPELYQSLNAMFVIAFTPLIVAFFALMRRRNRPISTARKLFYGLVLTTASMVLMALAGLLTEDGAAKVSGMWLVAFYAVVTIGELFLSPMGLSLVTKLTPGRLVGLAMGGWFMATAFGNNLSGFFGGIQESLDPVNFFLVLAGLAGAAAMFIRMMLPRLEATLKQYGA
jgi:dipeptide/tripeptide permease